MYICASKCACVRGRARAWTTACTRARARAGKSFIVHTAEPGCLAGWRARGFHPLPASFSGGGGGGSALWPGARGWKAPPSADPRSSIEDTGRRSRPRGAPPERAPLRRARESASLPPTAPPAAPRVPPLCCTPATTPSGFRVRVLPPGPPARDNRYIIHTRMVRVAVTIGVAQLPD